MCQAITVKQLLISLGFLDGVEIRPLKILNERKLKDILITDIPYDYWDLIETS